jgi:hypothetical protein
MTERTNEGFEAAYKAAQTQVNVVGPRGGYREEEVPAPISINTTPEEQQQRQEREPPPQQEQREEGKENKEGETDKPEGQPEQPRKIHPRKLYEDLSWVDEADPESLKERVKELAHVAKSADGRTAYLQRQLSRQQQPRQATQPEAPKYIPPPTPEKWAALNESDPALAEAQDARIKAEIEAVNKYWEDRYNADLAPLKQAEQRRQAQAERWEQEQVETIYREFPDIEQRIQSKEYNFWLDGMEQQAPGYKDWALSVMDAPTAVEIMKRFDKDLNEYYKSQSSPAEVSVDTTKADKIAQQRNERLNTPTLPSGSPTQTLSSRREDINKEAGFLQAYKKARERLGYT